jgi:hypothetical protein
MDYEKRINELNNLRKKRNKVRLYMGLLVIVSSLLPVTYIILQVRSFVTGEKANMFVASTLEKIPWVIENHKKTATDSIDRVAGRFIDEFQRVADRDFPVLEPAFHEELGKVVDHAGRRWSVVSNSIDVMALNHQRAIVEKLNNIIQVEMDEEKVSALAERYKRKMLDRIDQRWKAMYQMVEPSMRRIEHNLVSMVEKEPDLINGVGSNQALGVLLEYVGLELQSRETF